MDICEQVAAVSAEIDRAFRDAMRECGQRAGRALAARHGGPGAGILIIDLRTVLIDEFRSVAPADFAELTRYADQAEMAKGVDAVEARGMITRDADGSIRGTAACRAFLVDLYATQAEVLADYWSPDAVAALTPPLGRLVTAALAGAPAVRGSALGATSPPAEPDGTPDTVLLLNRLSTMRYHRSDAHAAAWRAAGFSAADMVALQERGGPERDAIERRTNELAAPAYAGEELANLTFRMRAILRHHATS